MALTRYTENNSARVYSNKTQNEILVENYGVESVFIGNAANEISAADKGLHLSTYGLNGRKPENIDESRQEARDQNHKLVREIAKKCFDDGKYAEILSKEVILELQAKDAAESKGKHVKYDIIQKSYNDFIGNVFAAVNDCPELSILGTTEVLSDTPE